MRKIYTSVLGFRTRLLHNRISSTYNSFVKMISLSFAISLLLILVACDSNNPVEIRSRRARHDKGDILIGAAGPWERLEKNREFLKEGIIFAEEEINSSGGVLGRKLKLIFKDDKGTVKEGKLVAREFCNNKNIVAVIGHVNSSVAISASVLYNHYGVIMLSPASTTPGLTMRPDNKFIFRNIATDRVFSKKLAEYAVNTGFKNKAFIDTIVIYNEDDVYGNELAKEFEDLVTQYRIKTVARRIYGMDSNKAFFKNDLNHIVGLYSFDAIFIAGLGEHATMLINEANKLGLNIQIFCSQGVDGEELINDSGKSADGVIYCSTFDPNKKTPEIDKFKKAFKKRFGFLPGDDAVQGYDSLYVLANAMKLAGSSAPEDIAKALHKINYKGLAGNISFDENGDLKEENVILMKIENLKEKVIE